MPLRQFLPQSNMEQVDNTAPVLNSVRLPNSEELQQLEDWLAKNSIGAVLPDWQLSSWIAVFDHYCTDCPGYAGKIMSVVWGGAPSYFDVFYWKNGKLLHSDREYNDKECARCGRYNGTLCVNCWRASKS